MIKGAKKLLNTSFGMFGSMDLARSIGVIFNLILRTTKSSAVALSHPLERLVGRVVLFLVNIFCLYR
jgi:hypothetical protein